MGCVCHHTSSINLYDCTVNGILRILSRGWSIMVRKQDGRTKIVSLIIFKNYSFRILNIWDDHYSSYSTTTILHIRRPLFSSITQRRSLCYRTWYTSIGITKSFNSCFATIRRIYTQVREAGVEKATMGTK